MGTEKLYDVNLARKPPRLQEYERLLGDLVKKAQMALQTILILDEKDPHGAHIKASEELDNAYLELKEFQVRTGMSEEQKTDHAFEV